MNKGYHLDVNMSDHSSIGFNVTKNKVPSVLESKIGSVTRIIAYPRNSRDEYYRTRSGNIISPYGLSVSEEIS